MLGNIDEMKDRLNMMIPQYVDNEIVLTNLLALYTDLDNAKNEYQKQTKTTDAPLLRLSVEISKNVSSSSSDDDTSVLDDLKISVNNDSDSDSDDFDKIQQNACSSVAAGSCSSSAAGSSAKTLFQQRTTPLSTCLLCFEDDICASDTRTLEACGHCYCVECLAHMFNTLINEGRVLKISCPDPDCREPIDYNDVAAVVDIEQLSKYENFSFVAGLSSLGSSSIAWCATADCETIMSVDDNAPNKLVCENCFSTRCALCNETFHTGTCKDFKKWKQKRKGGDTKFAKYKMAHCKPCPKCGQPIEKNGGCHHMHCSNCGTDFSWYLAGNPLQKARTYLLIGGAVAIAVPVAAALAVPALVAGGSYWAYESYKERQYRKKYYY